MDCSLPDCSVHEILLARILKWVAIPFSRASSWPRDQTWVPCIAVEFLTVWAAREGPVSSIIRWLFLGPPGKPLTILGTLYNIFCMDTYIHRETHEFLPLWLLLFWDKLHFPAAMVPTSRLSFLTSETPGFYWSFSCPMWQQHSLPLTKKTLPKRGAVSHSVLLPSLRCWPPFSAWCLVVLWCC